MYTAWDEHTIDFTCVHEVGNRTTVSKIDHFFLSSSIKDQVEDAGVIHHVTNKSDHSPVIAVFSSLEIQQETVVKKTTKTKAIMAARAQRKERITDRHWMKS